LQAERSIQIVLSLLAHLLVKVEMTVSTELVRKMLKKMQDASGAEGLDWQ
jgi:hypothetical protein